MGTMTMAMEILAEYHQISQRLTAKQNELIKCKSKQQEKQLQADIHILELLLADVSYRLDKLYV